LKKGAGKMIKPNPFTPKSGLEPKVFVNRDKEISQGSWGQAQVFAYLLSLIFLTVISIPCTVFVIPLLIAGRSLPK